MKLTKYQIEHASNRLSAAMHEKVKSKFSCDKAPKVKQLDAKSMLDQIASGEAKLKPRKMINRYDSLLESFTYTEISTEEERAANRKWHKDRDAFIEKERAKVQSIVDSLIFCGDAAEVIKKIETYVNSK